MCCLPGYCHFGFCTDIDAFKRNNTNKSSESIDDDRITYPEYTFSRSKKAHTENNEWSEIQYIMNFRQQEVIKSMLIFNSHE